MGSVAFPSAARRFWDLSLKCCVSNRVNVSERSSVNHDHPLLGALLVGLGNTKVDCGAWNVREVA